MENTEGARFGGIVVILWGIVDEECLRGMLIAFSVEPDYKMVVGTVNIYTTETAKNRNKSSRRSKEEMICQISVSMLF